MRINFLFLFWEKNTHLIGQAKQSYLFSLKKKKKSNPIYCILGLLRVPSKPKDEQCFGLPKF